jgi:hypothetical protein
MATKTRDNPFYLYSGLIAPDARRQNLKRQSLFQHILLAVFTDTRKPVRFEDVSDKLHICAKGRSAGCHRKMSNTNETEPSVGTAASEEERTVAGLISSLEAQIRQLERQLVELEQSRFSAKPPVP